MEENSGPTHRVCGRLRGRSDSGISGTSVYLGVKGTCSRKIDSLGSEAARPREPRAPHPSYTHALPTEERDLAFAGFGAGDVVKRLYPALALDGIAQENNAPDASQRRRYRILERETGLEPDPQLAKLSTNFQIRSAFRELADSRSAQPLPGADWIGQVGTCTRRHLPPRGTIPFWRATSGLIAKSRPSTVLNAPEDASDYRSILRRGSRRVSSRSPSGERRDNPERPHD